MLAVKERPQALKDLTFPAGGGQIGRQELGQKPAGSHPKLGIYLGIMLIGICDKYIHKKVVLKCDQSRF